MKLNILIVITVLLLPYLVFADPVSAKIQGFSFTADDFYHDTDKDVIQLSGQVKIIYQNQQIQANHATLFLRSKNALFQGSVSITSPQADIVGNEVTLDYEGQTGLIKNGYVKSGNIVFQGSLIQKLGESEFYVLDADYTSCTNCPAGWSFQGNQIRAELGGYAYLKNTFFRVGGIPILWLPYLVVPLKSQRETGLLSPSFDHYDDKGLVVSQGFFWAISRSTDATFHFLNYEKAGPKLLTEYRYVLAEQSFGTIQAGTIRDRSFANESRYNLYRSNNNKYSPINRWFIKYDHYFDLPNGYVNRANLNLASDLQYPKDFPKETLNHGDPSMENRVSFTKNTNSQHFSIDTSYNVNLLHADPLASNEDAVHRLPEFKFSQMNTSIGTTGLMYSFDLDYTNFTRSGSSFDPISTTLNGTKYVTNKQNDPRCDNAGNEACETLSTTAYDPSKDLIRTGQRLDLKPTLSYPVKLSYMDVLPRVSYRETRYVFDVEQDRQNIRRYLRAEISGRTTFSKIYAPDNEAKANRYKHEIIPEVTYTVIPWRDQRSHPFFGTTQSNEAPFSSRDKISDADLANGYGLQFDYNDRIFDRNLVTFSILNKLIKKQWNQDQSSYQKVASFRVYQSYDLYQESLDSPNKQPWSDVGAILEVNFPHFATYTRMNYFPYQRVSNIYSSVKVSNDDGQFFKIGLNREYTIAPKGDVDTRTRTEDLSFAAGFTSGYVNLMGGLVYNLNWLNSKSDNKIKKTTWITQFKPPGDCWVVNFYRDQVIGGVSSWHLDFSFTFDGKPTPPLPPETLSTYGFD